MNHTSSAAVPVPSAELRPPSTARLTSLDAYRGFVMLLMMAEVLRLHLIEGKGIRAIAKATKLGRKKVRNLLSLSQGKDKPTPAQGRSLILAPYEEEIRKTLDDCADIRAPAMLDRLRANGYLVDRRSER